MGKIYQYQTRINTYESLPDGKMAPTAALQYFQESAQQQLESEAIGLSFLTEHHLAWILVKYEVDFYRYPEAEETVIVETEPLGYNRFEAFRRFAIRSEDGQILISGKSVWMLVDTETERIVRVGDISEIEKLLDPDGEVYKLSRLKRIKEFDHESRFKVRFLDIDINQHVNNVKYLAYAIESLPLEVLKNDEIEKLKIVFKAQAFYGEMIVAKRFQTGPRTWRIDICRDDGEVLCEIELTVRDRDHKLLFKSYE